MKEQEDSLKEDLFYLSEDGDISPKETIHSSDFNFDITVDTLNHIYSKSSLRKKLAKILAKFYKSPSYIILFSFLIGLIFFCVPLFLIYFQIFNNFMLAFLILIVINLILCLTLIALRIFDDLTNKVGITSKWERKNIIITIGLILSLIIFIVGIHFLEKFFDDILLYYNDDKLTIIYEKEEKEDKDEKGKIFINDFFIKYVVNCFLLNMKEIKNNDAQVINYISDYSIITDLIYKLKICSIPFLVYSFNKLIQTIIVEIKYTIPKIIFFSSICCLCILMIIKNLLYKEKEQNFYLPFIQMTFIILITFGYLSWCACCMWRRYKNPKDKNFAIEKYELSQLILIYIFDFMNIISTLGMFISILLNYINFNNKDATFKDLKIVVYLLKFGFLCFILSNSFYYGHYFLSLIFRPIALQYAPIKLKDNYVRASRNLSSYIFIQ